jgi:predicted Fe-S protein YdhL (DUF1289 family)
MKDEHGSDQNCLTQMCELPDGPFCQECGHAVEEIAPWASPEDAGKMCEESSTFGAKVRTAADMVAGNAQPTLPNDDSADVTHSYVTSIDFVYGG